MKYSVIIPTLNEEYFLAKNLESLNSFNQDIEIIISDGGSTDNTLNLAKVNNVKSINSAKGRGVQLNTGSTAAAGDILIFLHADTFLPENTFDLIEDFFCRFTK